MITDTFRVRHDAFRVVTDGQPVDEIALPAAFPDPGIVPAILVHRGSLQAAGQQPVHDFVGKGLHAAVGVVDDKPLARGEQLAGNERDRGFWEDQAWAPPACCKELEH